MDVFNTFKVPQDFCGGNLNLCNWDFSTLIKVFQITFCQKSTENHVIICENKI